VGGNAPLVVRNACERNKASQSSRSWPSAHGRERKFRALTNSRRWPSRVRVLKVSFQAHLRIHTSGLFCWKTRLRRLEEMTSIATVSMSGPWASRCEVR